tara:strand:+ start:3540 stop:4283 length:744 start_codon:yes stop_codon:yes gene_type:complete
MNKIAIIIPSRLNAQRLPDKPLKLINNKEMILHVYDLALKTNLGEVIVATPDQKIIDTVQNHGGTAVMTKKEHQTGTDRIFEVFSKKLENKTDIIINLQGDMPNLNPSAIEGLATYMQKKTCDIGTLASKIKNEKELKDQNICKVITNENISNNQFSEAVDFYRTSEKIKTDFIYHHIGIYAFTKEALIRYVSLKRSELELKRKLEQLRALEDGMKINVGYIDNYPLSVDTEKDLLNIKKIMEKNEK